MDDDRFNIFDTNEEEIEIQNKEINIAFFGLSKEQFNEILSKLNNLFFKDEYNESKDPSISEKYHNLVENINYSQKINSNNSFNFYFCNININKKRSYKEFIKNEIDYIFLFDSEEYLNDKKNINDLLDIFSQKENYYYFKNDKKINTLNLLESNIISLNPINFICDLLKNMIKIYEYYLIYLDYSVEKDIIKFGEYYSKYKKYEKLDENNLIELFEKFEKFSFNNDYADDTIILLQIICIKTNKGEILKDDFCFDVKKVKCSLYGEFCDNLNVVCSFSTEQKKFLCPMCIKQFMIEKNI